MYNVGIVAMLVVMVGIGAFLVAVARVMLHDARRVSQIMRRAGCSRAEAIVALKAEWDKKDTEEVDEFE